MEFSTLVERVREYPSRRPDSAGTRLANGQQPTVLFITCADSRIVPADITDAEPGTLFELRTAGNVVPGYRLDSPSSEMATIEFAVLGLGVSEVVVCGHSHCGAVAALHGAAIDHLPAMGGWLRSQAAVRPAPSSSDRALRAEGERHLLAQVRKLESYPFVRERVEAGALRVHGWFYDIETGGVSVPGPASFRPL